MIILTIINKYNKNEYTTQCTVDSLESLTVAAVETTNNNNIGNSRNDASSFISSSDVTGLVLNQQTNVATNNNNNHLNLNDATTLNNIKSDYGLTTL